MDVISHDNCERKCEPTYIPLYLDIKPMIEVFVDTPSMKIKWNKCSCKKDKKHNCAHKHEKKHHCDDEIDKKSETSDDKSNCSEYYDRKSHKKCDRDHDHNRKCQCQKCHIDYKRHNSSLCKSNY